MFILSFHRLYISDSFCCAHFDLVLFQAIRLFNFIKGLLYCFLISTILYLSKFYSKSSIFNLATMEAPSQVLKVNKKMRTMKLIIQISRTQVGWRCYVNSLYFWSFFFSVEYLNLCRSRIFLDQIVIFSCLMWVFLSTFLFYFIFDPWNSFAAWG